MRTRRGRQRQRAVAALAALALFAPVTEARADEVSGIAFEDLDGDGVRDEGEPGRAGIAVSDGRRVTRTDADGRYSLEGGGRFVQITRPAGFDCAKWYREAGGDFALVARAKPEDELFFVHVSDAHVYPERRDFAEHSSPPMPWFIPDWLAPWITFLMLENFYGPEHNGDIAPAFRDAMRPYYEGDDLDSLSDRALMQAYQTEFARDGSQLGDVADAARRAFAELSALDADFIVNTGDLVLEGNQATHEAMVRWLEFYEELVSAVDVPVYSTIGNNEIGGNQNESWPANDPRFGKALFHRHLGPSHYSFDRGPFHFVALDTHRVRPGQDDPKEWTHYEMDDEVAEWARADLVMHRDRVLVVLNHEPFHEDASWPLAGEAETASDAGLFAELGVPYALSGHTHWRSYQQTDETHHFTTGALSGMRWVLPASLHERGYHLFYARDRRLYGAWKPLHAPVIAPAEPAYYEPGEPSELVIVASDVTGPFARVEASRSGRPLPIERWGDYFLRVRLDEAGSGEVSVAGTRADGSVFEGRVSVP